MAKSYRRRSRRHKGKSSDGLLGLLLILGVIAYSYKDSLDTITSTVLYVLLFAAVFLAFVGGIKLWRTWRRKQLKITVRYMQAEIDTMDGLEFERYVASLMKKNGYGKIRMTERYDLGVDIIAHKDGIIWGVQVKRCSGMVKAAAVRQVVTALKKYKCDRAMVITNATYSRPAKELALNNDCILMDGFELAKWVND